MVHDAKMTKERWLERLSFRLHMGLFLKSAVDRVVLFCLCFGATILFAKMFFPASFPMIWWLGLGAIPVLWFAYRSSRKLPFSESESTALLDRRMGAGGLLMTIMESPDDQWEKQLPVAESVWKRALPAWRPWRTLKHLAVPVLFVVAVCFLPNRIIESLTTQPSVISADQINQLQEMLDELDENDILTEDEKEALEKEIAKLAEETMYQPLTHENWETVDALKDQMNREVTSRENKLNQAASAAAALERALDSDESVSDKQKSTLEELLNELNNQADGSHSSNSAGDQSSDQANESGQQGLQDKLAELSKNGQVQLPSNASELKKALEELKEYIKNESQKVGDCREGGT